MTNICFEQVRFWSQRLLLRKNNMGMISRWLPAFSDVPPRRWLLWLSYVVFAIAVLLLLAPSIRRLSFNLWLGAIATGLCFAFVSLGVYLSFRVLNYPDLTIDGSFPLGAAISARMILAGFDPFVTLPVAVFGGLLAGTATGIIATRLRIHSLLASILTSTALYSVNLRVMGRSNIPLLNEGTVFRPFAADFRAFLQGVGGERLAATSKNLLAILMVGLLVLLLKWIFDWFMHTEVGLSLRATGDNPQMIRALGVNTSWMFILGLALSNALVALSGALFAHFQGFADVNMGLGLIIAGLAAVILGETLFRPASVRSMSLAVVGGMIVYRIVIAAALSVAIPLPGGESLRIGAQDVKLATAVLVLGALWFTSMQNKARRE